MRTLPFRWQMIVALAAVLLPGGWPLGSLSSLPNCYREEFPLSGWAAAWYPDEPTLAWRAGIELAAAGDDAGAVCLFRLVADRLGLDAAFAADYGDALDRQGWTAEAVAVWEGAGRREEAILGRLAEGYEAIGSWTQAEIALTEWLARHPDDTAGHCRLAFIRAAQDPVQALGWLDRAAAAKADCSAAAGQLAGAIRDAQRGEPAYLYARVGEVFIAQSEWALAATALRESVTLRPDYGEAFALLGLAEEKSGADPEAAYRAGADLAPHSATACLLFGSWLRRHGEPDLARIWLERAWTLAPGDWATAAELAALETVSGRISSAEAYLLESVRSHPKAPSAWLALAEFYIGNEIRVEESGIPAARQVLLLAPENTHALLLLGKAYYLIADFRAAEAILRRLLEKAPESAEAHFYLGACLMETDGRAAAIPEWKLAVRFDPAGEVGRRAAALLADSAH